MVGEVDVSRVLDSGRLEAVVSRALGGAWRAGGCSLRAAADGLTGFLGDHFRATLTAHAHTGHTHTLHLFVKCLPLANKDKAEFIDENNFNRREMLMFKLFEEMGGDDGPNPWRPKAYLYDETILVMPDLATEGFAPRHYLDTLGVSDVLLVAASVARFHAAFACYDTRRTRSLLDEYGHVIYEPTFCASPWMRAAAKLSANIIDTFSIKYKNTIPDLEAKLYKLYLEASESLRYEEDAFNVIVHKDLWMNNILFAPGKAIIVDYQCVRYGPPAFDLTMLLYLCTSREFREKHEKEVFLHYYSVFTKSLEINTEKRLAGLGYDRAEFLRRCESSRLTGLVYAVGIFPYVLMDPATAQRTFDDPSTYERYCNEDRSVPVLQHARSCHQYRRRQVVATEELIERYILHNYNEIIKN